MDDQDNQDELDQNSSAADEQPWLSIILQPVDVPQHQKDRWAQSLDPEKVRQLSMENDQEERKVDQ